MMPFTFPIALISKLVHTPSDQGSILKRSVRLSGAKSYFTWTPSSSATNLKTGTISFWIKPVVVGGVQHIISARKDLELSTIEFTSEGHLSLLWQEPSLSLFIKTRAVYRDPTAWMHVVVTWNTDGRFSTSAKNFSIEVNGVSAELQSGAVYPRLNLEQVFFDKIAKHDIGYSSSSANSDMYLSQVIGFEGIEARANSFGRLSSDGNWVSGDLNIIHLGTNGFWLDFEDASNLGNSIAPAASNNWEVVSSNIIKQVKDSPTNKKSQTIGNYWTWSPIIHKGESPQFSLGVGNTRYLINSGLHNLGGDTWGTLAFNADTDRNRYVFAWKKTHFSSESALIGLGTLGDIYSPILSRSQEFIYSRKRGEIFINGVSFGAIVNQDINNKPELRIEIDLSIKTHNVKVFSGGHLGGTYSWVPTGFISCFCAHQTSLRGNEEIIIISDVDDMAGTVTPGYLPLTTATLPPSPIPDPTAHFQITLYRGTGVAQSITQSGNATFSPGLIWIKDRTNNRNHVLYDNIRGRLSAISPNSNDRAVNRGLTSVDASGFSVGTDAEKNNLNSDFVAWQWKTDIRLVPNSSGTIRSITSVNKKAGFSVIHVNQGGTGVIATIGHGLKSKPQMIIGKRLDEPRDWPVYNHTVSARNPLYLNGVEYGSEGGREWNHTEPTDTVFSVGATSFVNASGGSYIFYAWHSIDGYSLISSYKGNGLTDGTFIYCGFRPAWVMIKRTDYRGSWIICDAARDTYNPVKKQLIANISIRETNSNDNYDFLATGFKIRTGSGSVNINNASYIFMAFAEMSTAAQARSR